jgi:hypothetical protein
MKDSYLRSSKPGKRGRRAGGKEKLVVAVETKGNKAGFPAMQHMGRLSSNKILKQTRDEPQADCVVRTNDWCSYGIFNSTEGHHQPVVVGCGKNAVKHLPWVHRLIVIVNGSIWGAYHCVSSKHLGRYLAQFCYQVSRRFWKSQLFDHLLTACLNCSTVMFAELKA